MASVTSTINVQALAAKVYALILKAAENAVDDTAERGVRYAKRLAPVRKVSTITRNQFARPLTSAEKRQLPASIRQGLTGAQINRLQVAQVRRQQAIEAPELLEDVGTRRMAGTGHISLRDPSQAVHLTGRGVGELGRRDQNAAIYRGGAPHHRIEGRRGLVAGATLGGRLRGEITSISVPNRGGRIRADIISPTPYAKYVEFPTTRTAAQPYMRPTLMAMKRPYVEAMRRHLKRIPGSRFSALGGG